MEVVILGASGQVGLELQKVFPGARVVTRNELDLSQAGAVARFDFSRADVVINAAAYTEVDMAETKEGAKAAAAINAMAVLDLVDAAHRNKFTLVQYSTDYVFDGTKKEPYTEDDKPNALNVYGKTKLAGEMAALHAPKSYVIRTSWVFGEGKNFVRTMLELAKSKKELTIVNDQVGRPTYAKDIAQATAQLVYAKASYGLYNFTNEGVPVSWVDFAREIFKQKNLKVGVGETTSEEYGKMKSPYAKRPKNSVLDLSKIKNAGVAPRQWQEALKEFLLTS
jgi:dTDP-4-dehydrorhamnose 3,5-epimerase